MVRKRGNKRKHTLVIIAIIILILLVALTLSGIIISWITGHAIGVGDNKKVNANSVKEDYLVGMTPKVLDMDSPLSEDFGLGASYSYNVGGYIINIQYLSYDSNSKIGTLLVKANGLSEEIYFKNGNKIPLDLAKDFNLNLDSPYLNIENIVLDSSGTLTLTLTLSPDCTNCGVFFPTYLVNKDDLNSPEEGIVVPAVYRVTEASSSPSVPVVGPFNSVRIVQDKPTEIGDSKITLNKVDSSDGSAEISFINSAGEKNILNIKKGGSLTLPSGQTLSLDNSKVRNIGRDSAQMSINAPLSNKEELTFAYIMEKGSLGFNSKKGCVLTEDDGSNKIIDCMKACEFLEKTDLGSLTEEQVKALLFKLNLIEDDENMCNSFNKLVVIVPESLSMTNNLDLSLSNIEPLFDENGERYYKVYKVEQTESLSFKYYKNIFQSKLKAEGCELKDGSGKLRIIVDEDQFSSCPNICSYLDNINRLSDTQIEDLKNIINSEEESSCLDVLENMKNYLSFYKSEDFVSELNKDESSFLSCGFRSTPSTQRRTCYCPFSSNPKPVGRCGGCNSHEQVISAGFACEPTGPSSTLI